MMAPSTSGNPKNPKNPQEPPRSRRRRLHLSLGKLVGQGVWFFHAGLGFTSKRAGCQPYFPMYFVCPLLSPSSPVFLFFFPAYISLSLPLSVLFQYLRTEVSFTISHWHFQSLPPRAKNLPKTPAKTHHKPPKNRTHSSSIAVATISLSFS